MRPTLLNAGTADHYDHLQLQRLRVVTAVHLADRTLSRRSDVEGLMDELRRVIEGERPTHMLINFAFVAYCSSELINSLIDFRSLAAANNVQLRVCGMRDEIRRVFQVLNLDGTMFDIHDSASAAVRSFSDRGLRSRNSRSFPTAYYG